MRKVLEVSDTQNTQLGVFKFDILMHSTLYITHLGLHTLHSTLHMDTHHIFHTRHSTLYTFHSSGPTLYTLHFTLHTLLHFITAYTPHSTLYTPQFGRSIHFPLDIPWLRDTTLYTWDNLYFFTLPYFTLTTPYSSTPKYPAAHPTIYTLEHSTRSVHLHSLLYFITKYQQLG